MEPIRAMLDEMSKDTGFGKEMQALIKDRDTAAIIVCAREKGFIFTGEDWNGYLRWCEGINSDSRKPVQGADLSPDELENISGGNQNEFGDPKPGEYWNPHIGNCWFHAGSEPEYRNGRMRKKCNQFACKAMYNVQMQFAQCGCWGTDKCVGNWHYAEGCPN